MNRKVIKPVVLSKNNETSANLKIQIILGNGY